MGRVLYCVYREPRGPHTPQPAHLAAPPTVVVRSANCLLLFLEWRCLCLLLVKTQASARKLRAADPMADQSHIITVQVLTQLATHYTGKPVYFRYVTHKKRKEYKSVKK